MKPSCWRSAHGRCTAVQASNNRLNGGVRQYALKLVRYAARLVKELRLASICNMDASDALLLEIHGAIQFTLCSARSQSRDLASWCVPLRGERRYECRIAPIFFRRRYNRLLLAISLKKRNLMARFYRLEHSQDCAQSSTVDSGREDRRSQQTVCVTLKYGTA